MRVSVRAAVSADPAAEGNACAVPLARPCVRPLHVTRLFLSALPYSSVSPWCLFGKEGKIFRSFGCRVRGILILTVDLFGCVLFIFNIGLFDLEYRQVAVITPHSEKKGNTKIKR